MAKTRHKITYQGLLKILPSNELKILTDFVFCPDCDKSKIIDYENSIYVNDLFDMILEGKCDKCGKKVARYIETGEHDENMEKLKEILFQK